MGDILRDNHAIFLGLYTALTRTRNSSRVVYQKIVEAQKQYFINLSGAAKLSEDQLKTLEVLDDAMHKFYFAGYSLEQLWEVYQYLKVTDCGLPELYDENLTHQRSPSINSLTKLFCDVYDFCKDFLPV